eukprot:745989-Hanusia_phi.AAC.1
MRTALHPLPLREAGRRLLLVVSCTDFPVRRSLTVAYLVRGEGRGGKCAQAYHPSSSALHESLSPASCSSCSSSLPELCPLHLSLKVVVRLKGWEDQEKGG